MAIVADSAGSIAAALARLEAEAFGLREETRRLGEEARRLREEVGAMRAEKEGLREGLERRSNLCTIYFLCTERQFTFLCIIWWRQLGYSKWVSHTKFNCYKHLVSYCCG